jgi:dihydrodipicolinate synthase/N-acetylneuraminate lyase
VPVVTPPDDDARLDDQALAAHADGLLTAGAAAPSR